MKYVTKSGREISFYGAGEREDLDKFFEMLDDTIQLVIEQLLERFEIQAKKKVKNFPFLMGQSVWIDSDKLKPNDEVREVIKHGTLTMGVIGLAETLKALTRTNSVVNARSISDFIDTLKVNDEVKAELKRITPHSYTGY